jgi:hypothetical protein
MEAEVFDVILWDYVEFALKRTSKFSRCGMGNKVQVCAE